MFKDKYNLKQIYEAWAAMVKDNIATLYVCTQPPYFSNLLPRFSKLLSVYVATPFLNRKCPNSCWNHDRRYKARIY